MQKFTIAAVQDAPVYMDRGATTDKACQLIVEASTNGARLIVFPEAFIPTYPNWIWALPPSQNQMLSELYAELLQQAVTIPSPVTDQLCQAAKRSGVYVVIGLNERNAEASNTTLYNTLLYIDPKGKLLGKHRKLLPTAPERMVWGRGDGSTLDVYDTSLGRIGGLICWENYMPLARYAIYAWGVQIYLAPTYDEGEPWLSSLRHIAKEGGVYVVGCCMVLRQEDIPDRFEFKSQFYTAADEWLSEGDSVIVNPEGKFIAGPLNMEAGILYAEVDQQQLQASKWKFDVAGHYARPDVFELIVHKNPRPIITIDETPARRAQNESDNECE
jgi:nitrilase